MTEELLDVAIQDILKGVKEPLQPLQKDANMSDSDQRALTKMLTAVLDDTNKSHPENNRVYLAHIPMMHLSWAAMQVICNHSHLIETYAYMMSALYKESDTVELQKIWLALDNTELLSQLAKNGINWSRAAKKAIEKFYPCLYEEIFPEPQIYYYSE